MYIYLFLALLELNEYLESMEFKQQTVETQICGLLEKWMHYKCRHSLTWPPKRCSCFRIQSCERPSSTGQRYFVHLHKAPSLGGELTLLVMPQLALCEAWQRVSLSGLWFVMLAKENTKKKSKICDSWKSTRNCILNSPSHPTMLKRSRR